MRTYTCLPLFAALAASIPQAPHIPPTSRAHGFSLVANQTATSPDGFSIHGQILTSIHIGAGTSLAVFGHPISQNGTGRIFYLNGTGSDWYNYNTHILSDGPGAAHTATWGLRVADAPGTISSKGEEHAVTVEVGSGSVLSLARFPETVPRLLNPKGSGVWLGCRRYVGPVNTDLTVLAYLYLKNAADVVIVPEGCALVSLLPQCAELVEFAEHAEFAELEEGGKPSHDNAYEVHCYDRVEEVDWSL